MSERPILVQLPNWIGDAALAAPAIRALQAARPDARWILVGNSRSAPLYGRWPSDLLLVAGGGEGEGPFRLARRLRPLDCGAALILPVSFRSALAPFLAGIPRRVAFASDRRGFLLTDSIRQQGREVLLARQYMALAERLGVEPGAPLDPAIPSGDDEIDAQAETLRALDLEGGRTIALCPGATYGETKRWPVAHWIGLAGILQERGLSVLVLGGRDEIDVGARIAGELHPGARSLAGKLSLRESLALLHLLRGTVSNDSGAMHLAAAAGCPVLGLFGSTNPNWTGPLGRSSRVLWLALACSPCYSRSCPTRIECLRDLTPERVAAELEDLLADGDKECRL